MTKSTLVIIAALIALLALMKYCATHQDVTSSGPQIMGGAIIHDASSAGGDAGEPARLVQPDTAKIYANYAGAKSQTDYINGFCDAIELTRPPLERMGGDSVTFGDKTHTVTLHCDWSGK